MSSNRVRSSTLSSNSNAFLINVGEQKSISKSVFFRHPKTLQEKLLSFAVCVLLVLTTVFLTTLWIMCDRWKATLSQLKHIYVEEDDICQTDACKETAEGIISNIDPSTDPCVDFYQYACGGWIEKNPIPEGKGSYMVFQERSKEVKDSIAELVKEEADQENQTMSVRNVGKLFSACMNEDAINDAGLQPLKELLTEHGGWPMLGADHWKEGSYLWYKQTAKVNRELFLDIFMELDMKTNLEDNKYYVLFLKSGYFIFDNGVEHDFTDENRTQAACDFILNSARLMGSNLDDDTIREQAKEILAFEYVVHQASQEEVSADEDVEITLKTLQANAIDKTFSYKDFINGHLKSKVPVEDDTLLYVIEPPYFRNLPSILSETKKRIIANYIAFYIVYYFSDYSSQDIRNLTLEYEKALGSVGIRTEEALCLSITRAMMPFAVGRLYVDRYFPKRTRMHVSKMVEMIRLAYSSTLDQNTWMDENTLLYSLVKLQSIQSMVGYEEWILDDKLLDEYYSKLGVIQDDKFFAAILTLSEILSEEKYSRWNKTAERNETDPSTNNPTIVNAYYVPNTNLMTLPAGMYGYPYYKYGRIESINYGGIGTVIGHEISHAFDTKGRYFDHLGNLRDWWSQGTLREFVNKTECFVEQYNNFEDPLSKMSVDGLLTLGENIADNGGVRNAFKAFRLHLALSGENLNYRKRLPGLSASPEQLFFLGYASVWCAHMTEEYAAAFKEYDNHSPNKIRVNVPLTNFKEFAKAFKCRPGTPMNPIDKCVLW